MKINLLYNSDNILSGFLNIDPFASKDDQRKTLGPVHNLDTICEDSECQELIASDVIDYFSSIEVSQIISNWILKLRHGGKLIIGGVDILEVSKAVTNKYLNLTEANIILFGAQHEIWQFRKSCLSATELVKSLESCGLNIIKNRTNSYKYTVEAQRP